MNMYPCENCLHPCAGARFRDCAPWRRWFFAEVGAVRMRLLGPPKIVHEILEVRVKDRNFYS